MAADGKRFSSRLDPQAKFKYRHTLEVIIDTCSLRRGLFDAMKILCNLYETGKHRDSDAPIFKEIKFRIPIQITAESTRIVDPDLMARVLLSSDESNFYHQNMHRTVYNDTSASYGYKLMYSAKALKFMGGDAKYREKILHGAKDILNHYFNAHVKYHSDLQQSFDSLIEKVFDAHHEARHQISSKKEIIKRSIVKDNELYKSFQQIAKTAKEMYVEIDSLYKEALQMVKPEPDRESHRRGAIFRDRLRDVHFEATKLYTLFERVNVKRSELGYKSFSTILDKYIKYFNKINNKLSDVSSDFPESELNDKVGSLATKAQKKYHQSQILAVRVKSGKDFYSKELAKAKRNILGKYGKKLYEKLDVNEKMIIQSLFYDEGIWHHIDSHDDFAIFKKDLGEKAAMECLGIRDGDHNKETKLTIIVTDDKEAWRIANQHRRKNNTGVLAVGSYSIATALWTLGEIKDISFVGRHVVNFYERPANIEEREEHEVCAMKLVHIANQGYWPLSGKDLLRDGNGERKRGGRSS